MTDIKLKVMMIAQRILAPYVHSDINSKAPSKYYMEVTNMDNKLKRVYVSENVYKDLTTKVPVGAVHDFPWRLQERNFVFYGPGEIPIVATRVRLVGKKDRADIAQYIKDNGGTIAEANAAASKSMYEQAEAGSETAAGDTIADLTESRVLVVTKDTNTNEVAIRKDGIELTRAQQTDAIKQLTDMEQITPGAELRNLIVDNVMHTRNELVITLSRP